MNVDLVIVDDQDQLLCLILLDWHTFQRLIFSIVFYKITFSSIKEIDRTLFEHVMLHQLLPFPLRVSVD